MVQKSRFCVLCSSKNCNCVKFCTDPYARRESFTANIRLEKNDELIRDGRKKRMEEMNEQIQQNPRNTHNVGTNFNQPHHYDWIPRIEPRNDDDVVETITGKENGQKIETNIYKPTVVWKNGGIHRIQLDENQKENDQIKAHPYYETTNEERFDRYDQYNHGRDYNQGLKNNTNQEEEAKLKIDDNSDDSANNDDNASNGSDDLCCVCGDIDHVDEENDGWRLAVCSKCVKTTCHPMCFEPQADFIPIADWFCPECCLRGERNLLYNARTDQKDGGSNQKDNQNANDSLDELFDQLADDTVDPNCYICNKPEGEDSDKNHSNELLQCDECNMRVIHPKCLNPPIDFIPEENFYCLECRVIDPNLVNIEYQNPEPEVNTPNSPAQKISVQTYVKAKPISKKKSSPSDIIDVDEDTNIES